MSVGQSPAITSSKQWPNLVYCIYYMKLVTSNRKGASPNGTERIYNSGRKKSTVRYVTMT